MDPKMLSDALTTFLAPALPDLVKGGGLLVQEVGAKLGEGGVDLLKKLWAMMRPKLEERPAAVEAVQEVVQAPGNADAQGALRLQLRKILEADSSVAAEVGQLLEPVGSNLFPRAEVHGLGSIALGQGNVAAGAGGTAAGRDIKISKYHPRTSRLRSSTFKLRLGQLGHDFDIREETCPKERGV